MIKEKVISLYKNNLFNRCDDNGCVFYFSSKDFPEINSEDYSFTSSKGDILKGKFYFYDNYKDDNQLIIFDHGMGGGHLSYFREIEVLARKGYKVLSYDHTGCMESEGESTGGFCQSLSDLVDCINSLKNDIRFVNTKISVIGHSWGAFAALNVSKYHDDIKCIVAMSGFISLEQILKQTFGPLFKSCYPLAYELEQKSNPDYVNDNAIESLKDYKGNFLFIHSKDDKIVKYKNHFKLIEDEYNSKSNFNFLLVDKKGHNPNYTEEAVNYKDKFFDIYKKQLKNKKLVKEEQKEAFKNSFNWFKMTQQDSSIWNHIFTILEK